MPGVELTRQLVEVYHAVCEERTEADDLMGRLLPYLTFALQGAWITAMQPRRRSSGSVA